MQQQWSKSFSDFKVVWHMPAWVIGVWEPQSFQPDMSWGRQAQSSKRRGKYVKCVGCIISPLYGSKQFSTSFLGYGQHWEPCKSYVLPWEMHTKSTMLRDPGPEHLRW